MAGTGLEKAGVALGVKATAGIVKLFFAPHLESIKENLREKSLKKKISDKNIEKLFIDYLSILHKKCNTLETIMFPQQEILLESIYEPLILEPKYHYEPIKEPFPNYVDFLIHGDLKENLLLLDTAGMGKSTFTKYLILRVLQNTMHSKIPIFVELRKVSEDETLLAYIVKELNPKAKNNFTEEMLLKLMEKGKFIFFFDGFDEVTESKNRTIGDEISNISSNFSDNLIVLTSREQPYIPKLHNQVTCSFKPLVLEQIKSLLLKYDACAGIEVGQKLIEHENFKTLNYQLFNTPLMVNLLYKSFGYNKTIDNNVVTFYNEMFDALYKGHDLTKAGFAREKSSGLNFEEFKRLFNAFCFMALFENKASFKTKMEVIETINKAKRLSDIELEDTETFLKDLLHSVPLLTRDGLEFKFMHKTIMEFFAAEFLSYSTISHELFEKIKLNESMNSFKKCFEFLYDINKSLYIKEVGKDFLVEFIDFCKKPKYVKYREDFKSILFNNNDVTIKLSKEATHDSDGMLFSGNLKGGRFYLSLEEKNIKYLLDINIVRKNKMFLEKLFEEIGKGKFNNRLQFSSVEVEFLLNHLRLNKEYSLFSTEVLNLENSKLFNQCLFKIIYGSIKIKFTQFDVDKCQNLLDSIDNKLDIFD